MLIIFLIRGYKKGLISRLLALVILILANFIAWLLYKPFGVLFPVLPRNLNPFDQTILADFFYLRLNRIVWFLILFLIAWIVLKLMKPVVEFIAKAPIIRLIDRLLGALINLMIYGFILVSLTVILSTPLIKEGRQLVDQSVLKYIEFGLEKSVDLTSPYLKKARSISRFAYQPRQATEEDIINVAEYLKEEGILGNDIDKFLKEKEMVTNE